MISPASTTSLLLWSTTLLVCGTTLLALVVLETADTSLTHGAALFFWSEETVLAAVVTSASVWGLHKSRINFGTDSVLMESFCCLVLKGLRWSLTQQLLLLVLSVGGGGDKTTYLAQRDSCGSFSAVFDFRSGIGIMFSIPSVSALAKFKLVSWFGISTDMQIRAKTFSKFNANALDFIEQLFYRFFKNEQGPDYDSFQCDLDKLLLRSDR